MIQIIHPPHDLSPLYHVVGGYNLRLNDMEMSQGAIAPGMLATIILREEPKRVIEIGTCKGGLSALLSYICQTTGAEFVTMDTRGDSLIYQLAPCGRFLNWNCFENIEEIKGWIGSPGLTLLICDGGNKVLEFNTFSQFLKPGDIIGAHDFMIGGRYSSVGWGFCEVVLQNLKLDGLTPFHHYWTEMSGWTMWTKV